MNGALFALAAGLSIAAAASDDAFDLAARALAAGSRAVETGDRARLRAAALALQSSGAAPATGGEDVAAHWLRRAHAAPAPRLRDRALGPAYRALALGGGGAVRFEQTFLAGQRARITVVPESRSDFAMRVTDDDRATVCRATPRHARCDWVPSYTTRFSIEVANPGRQAGRYFLLLQ